MTWIKQNLDTLCHNYFRRWLNIPAGGTVQILQLSKSKFGIEILDISTKFTCCQITIRQCPNKSPNPDIHYLFKITSHKNTLLDKRCPQKHTKSKGIDREKFRGARCFSYGKLPYLRHRSIGSRHSKHFPITSIITP